MADSGPQSDNQQPPDNRQGKPPPPRMKMSRGVMSWIGFILIALMIVMVVSQNFAPTKDISIDQFWREADSGDYSEIVLSDDNITGTYNDQAQGQPSRQAGKRKFKVQYNTTFCLDDLRKELIQRCPSTTIKYEPSTQPWINMLLGIIPWLLIVAFIWFVVFRQLRSSAGGAGMLGNFGRSRHRVSSKELTNVTFKDVAGVDEAKEEVEEIIEFLKSPKKFQRLGGRIPRGVLLVGEPGCGKTLLAKAIAGEADVPFFSISGADFVEMFVGVGASRVRDLFKSAKENSPCIIFLDEIDAVGRKRGAAYSGGGHDEREQTLNAILVEMDGFDTSDQVIVISATNRDDILDPALTRPGRFDRRVYVPLPDIKGRLEILKVHAKKIKLAPDIDLMRLARGTPMFSGAELAAIINEGAIIATMQEKDTVEMEDLEEARDKVRYGRSNKSRAIEEKERVATAYHEAGHAVLQTLLKDADPLHKVTIIPRGPAMGATMSLPEKDRYGYGLKWLQSTLRVMCGGRIAEKRHCNDISSGAAMDIEQVTRMARAMILEWGMSEKLGFVKYSPLERNEFFMGEKPYSDETAHVIDEEIRRLADEAYSEAKKLLNDNWDKVEAVAQALLKHETLDAEEVERLCRGESLDKPSLSGLLAEEASQPQPDKTPSAQPSTEPELPDGLAGGSLPQPG
ncbi:MAG: ATP-dependent zinc metalloprotease FtsH [Phycisphaerales bacterium]|nr:ATP-dependent zinc metalloprotease FtsH [Phycisphaerales bacterium]